MAVVSEAKGLELARNDAHSEAFAWTVMVVLTPYTYDVKTSLESKDAGGQLELVPS